jgi:transposase
MHHVQSDKTVSSSDAEYSVSKFVHNQILMQGFACENSIRPFVLVRNYWLFSVTPKGAAASAAIYSIIETAKANGPEPYLYFRYLLEKLPEAMTEDDYKSLLPQYVNPSDLADPAKVA